MAKFFWWALPKGARAQAGRKWCLEMALRAGAKDYNLVIVADDIETYVLHGYSRNCTQMPKAEAA